MLGQTIDSWMIKPDNFRMLKQLRKLYREDTGQDFHITDQESILQLLNYCRSSDNESVQQLAQDISKVMQQANG